MVKKVKKDDVNSEKNESKEFKESKDVSEKSKDKGNYGKIILLIVFAFLVFLVVFTLYNYSDKNDVNDIKNKNTYDSYNGFLFEKDSFGFWETTIKSYDGNKNFVFRKHPLDLEKMDFNNSALEHLAVVQYVDGFFTISIDPLLSDKGMMGVIGFDLANVMASYFGFNIKSGLLYDKESELGLYKVYTCNDSSVSNFVVEFRQSQEDFMYLDGFCLVIGVNDFDETLKFTSLFMFKALGIIY